MELYQRDMYVAVPESRSVISDVKERSSVRASE